MATAMVFLLGVILGSLVFMWGYWMGSRQARNR